MSSVFSIGYVSSVRILPSVMAVMLSLPFTNVTVFAVSGLIGVNGNALVPLISLLPFIVCCCCCFGDVAGVKMPKLTRLGRLILTLVPFSFNAAAALVMVAFFVEVCASGNICKIFAAFLLDAVVATNVGDTTFATPDKLMLPLVFNVIKPNVLAVGLGDNGLWVLLLLMLLLMLPPDALDGLIDRDCDNDDDEPADGEVAADGNDEVLVFNVSVDALLWASIE